MTTNSKIQFLKVRNVLSPSRAYDFDAGIDFYVPQFNSTFIKDLKDKNPDIFSKKECCCHSNGVYTLASSGTLTISGSASTTYVMEDKNDSIIKFDDEKGLNYFLLAPHQGVLIPSGIHVRMAGPGRALIAANKSGIASKHQLVFGAEVVDYLYQGEVHINVINTSTKVVRIYEDMKLIQFVETPVINSDINVVNPNFDKDDVQKDKFYEGMQRDRGEGGFGSSNEKNKK